MRPLGVPGMINAYGLQSLRCQRPCSFLHPLSQYVKHYLLLLDPLVRAGLTSLWSLLVKACGWQVWEGLGIWDTATVGRRLYFQ